MPDTNTHTHGKSEFAFAAIIEQVKVHYAIVLGNETILCFG